MHGHTRRAPYSTNGINLLRTLDLTLVTLDSRVLVDDRDLSQVPRRPGFDEWNARGETQTIDATPRGDVVEGVEDDRERLEVGHVECRIVENVSVTGQVNGRFGVVAGGNHEKRRLGSHLAFGHADVSRSE